MVAPDEAGRDGDGPRSMAGQAGCFFRRAPNRDGGAGRGPAPCVLVWVHGASLARPPPPPPPARGGALALARVGRCRRELGIAGTAPAMRET